MQAGDLASEFSAAAKLEGYIAVLELSAGEHIASLVIDKTFNASELRIESPGGGGYGCPSERSLEEIELDVQLGYVTPEGALRDYGVKLDEHGRATRLGECAK